MSTPTNIQTIMQNGRPAFVVIPYEEYLRLMPPRIPEDGFIPDEVVWLSMDKGWTLARAWREYLKLTQKEVAERMGITQAALSQIEETGHKPRPATLERLAQALGIRAGQLKA